MQPAWDVAYAWRKAEPTTHHTAMPWQILLGLIAVCLLWGWPRVAGALAVTWGGLLRIGETLQSLRSDLLLKEPKTRFRQARHQSVRIDQPDLLRLIDSVFGSLRPHEKLWPWSGQTLRNRFRAICKAIHLPTERAPGRPHLELASLRAGGATWLMLQTEDAELTRRRGRWLSSKIAEIYIQEASALQLLPTLDAVSRSLVFQALSSFPTLVQKAEFFLKTGVPVSIWYELLAADMHA